MTESNHILSVTKAFLAELSLWIYHYHLHPDTAK